MKIVGLQKLQINEEGKIEITPETQDDLWILSNAITPSDIVSADTTRKIPACNQTRVRFTADVKIIGVDYVKDARMLRVRGKIACNNSYVNANCFQTLELELDKAFMLEKKTWESNLIENLKESCKNKVGNDLVVVLVNHEIAQIYLVGKNGPKLCATLDGKIKGKLMEQSRFFGKIVEILTKSVDFSLLECMVIAGPGPAKNGLRVYLLSQASKVKSMERVKSRMVIVGEEDVGKKGLGRVLSDPGVMKSIDDTKLGTELKAIKELNEMFVFHPEKACYGCKSVEQATELSAIEMLLIMDVVLRSDDSEARKKYAVMVDSVKEDGGKTVVLSSKLVAGIELAQLTETGVAAILRFPLPEIGDSDF